MVITFRAISVCHSPYCKDGFLHGILPFPQEHKLWPGPRGPAFLFALEYEFQACNEVKPITLFAFSFFQVFGLTEYAFVMHANIR